MKVESKTATTTARAGAKAPSKPNSKASATARTGGGKRSSASGNVAPRTVAAEGTAAAGSTFDPTQHHALHYNIHGYPIEIRREKDGSQNGQVLKEKIAYPKTWLDDKDVKTKGGSSSIFLDGKANRNVRRYQDAKKAAGIFHISEPDHARKTLAKLHELRKREFLPDFSYDLNGDGHVTSKELYIASLYDKNKDGVLDAEERKECLDALKGGFEA